jgi:hypothetical protein
MVDTGPLVTGSSLGGLTQLNAGAGLFLGRWLERCIAVHSLTHSSMQAELRI